MYFTRCETGIIYLLLYVDDMLIVSHCMVSITELKMGLGREFDTKDLGRHDEY